MSQNPTPSLLDPGQIVKRAFDGTNDRIRVDAAITAPDGTSILIDATTDSIKIGNTASGPFLNINGDGSINTSGSSTVTGTVNTNLNGLATFKTTQYDVGITAVQLTPSPLTNRSSMSIKVKCTSNTEAVYINTTNSVSTINGFPLFNGDSVQLDILGSEAVWAIATLAGQKVYTLELG